MKLFYDPLSTTSRIVSFFLYDQNIPFEQAIVSTAEGEQRGNVLTSLNPNCQVPVLVEDDGFIVTESSAIIRYLADGRGLDVYPREARARVRVEQALSWFQTNFHVFHCVLLAYTYSMPQLRGLDPGVLATMRGIGQAGSSRYLKILNDEMIGDRAYVCGGDITLADYVGAANVTLGYYAGLDLGPYPNVARWLDTLAARPGWTPAYGPFLHTLSKIGDHAERLRA